MGSTTDYQQYQDIVSRVKKRLQQKYPEHPMLINGDLNNLLYATIPTLLHRNQIGILDIPKFLLLTVRKIVPIRFRLTILALKRMLQISNPDQDSEAIARLVTEQLVSILDFASSEETTVMPIYLTLQGDEKFNQKYVDMGSEQNAWQALTREGIDHIQAMKSIDSTIYSKYFQEGVGFGGNQFHPLTRYLMDRSVELLLRKLGDTFEESYYQGVQESQPHDFKMLMSEIGYCLYRDPVSDLVRDCFGNVILACIELQNTVEGILERTNEYDMVMCVFLSSLYRESGGDFSPDILSKDATGRVQESLDALEYLGVDWITVVNSSRVRGTWGAVSSRTRSYWNVGDDQRSKALLSMLQSNHSTETLDGAIKNIRERLRLNLNQYYNLDKYSGDLDLNTAFQKTATSLNSTTVQNKRNHLIEAYHDIVSGKVPIPTQDLELAKATWGQVLSTASVMNNLDTRTFAMMTYRLISELARYKTQPYLPVQPMLYIVELLSRYHGTVLDLSSRITADLSTIKPINIKLVEWLLERNTHCQYWIAKRETNYILAAKIQTTDSLTFKFYSDFPENATTVENINLPLDIGYPVTDTGIFPVLCSDEILMLSRDTRYSRSIDPHRYHHVVTFNDADDVGMVILIGLWGELKWFIWDEEKKELVDGPAIESSFESSYQWSNFIVEDVVATWHCTNVQMSIRRAGLYSVYPLETATCNHDAVYDSAHDRVNEIYQASGSELTIQDWVVDLLGLGTIQANEIDAKNHKIIQARWFLSQDGMASLKRMTVKDLSYCLMPSEYQEADALLKGTDINITPNLTTLTLYQLAKVSLMIQSKSAHYQELAIMLPKLDTLTEEEVVLVRDLLRGWKEMHGLNHLDPTIEVWSGQGTESRLLWKREDRLEIVSGDLVVVKSLPWKEEGSVAFMINNKDFLVNHQQDLVKILDIDLKSVLQIDQACSDVLVEWDAETKQYIVHLIFTGPEEYIYGKEVYDSDFESVSKTHYLIEAESALLYPGHILLTRPGIVARWNLSSGESEEHTGEVQWFNMENPRSILLNGVESIAVQGTGTLVKASGDESNLVSISLNGTDITVACWFGTETNHLTIPLESEPTAVNTSYHQATKQYIVVWVTDKVHGSIGTFDTTGNVFEIEDTVGQVVLHPAAISETTEDARWVVGVIGSRWSLVSNGTKEPHATETNKDSFDPEINPYSFRAHSINLSRGRLSADWRATTVLESRLLAETPLNGFTDPVQSCLHIFTFLKQNAIPRPTIDSPHKIASSIACCFALLNLSPSIQGTLLQTRILTMMETIHLLLSSFGEEIPGDNIIMLSGQTYLPELNHHDSPISKAMQHFKNIPPLQTIDRDPDVVRERWDSVFDDFVKPIIIKAAYYSEETFSCSIPVISELLRSSELLKWARYIYLAGNDFERDSIQVTTEPFSLSSETMPYWSDGFYLEDRGNVFVSENQHFPVARLQQGNVIMPLQIPIMVMVSRDSLPGDVKIHIQDETTLTKIMTTFSAENVSYAPTIHKLAFTPVKLPTTCHLVSETPIEGQLMMSPDLYLAPTNQATSIQIFQATLTVTGGDTEVKVENTLLVHQDEGALILENNQAKDVIFAMGSGFSKRSIVADNWGPDMSLSLVTHDQTYTFSQLPQFHTIMIRVLDSAGQPMTGNERVNLSLKPRDSMSAIVLNSQGSFTISSTHYIQVIMGSQYHTLDFDLIIDEIDGGTVQLWFDERLMIPYSDHRYRVLSSISYFSSNAIMTTELTISSESMIPSNNVIMVGGGQPARSVEWYWFDTETEKKRLQYSVGVSESVEELELIIYGEGMETMSAFHDVVKVEGMVKISPTLVLPTGDGADISASGMMIKCTRPTILHLPHHKYMDQQHPHKYQVTLLNQTSGLVINGVEHRSNTLLQPISVWINTEANIATQITSGERMYYEWSSEDALELIPESIPFTVQHTSNEIAFVQSKVNALELPPRTFQGIERINVMYLTASSDDQLNVTLGATQNSAIYPESFTLGTQKLTLAIVEGTESNMVIQSSNQGTVTISTDDSDQTLELSSNETMYFNSFSIWSTVQDLFTVTLQSDALPLLSSFMLEAGDIRSACFLTTGKPVLDTVLNVVSSEGSDEGSSFGWIKISSNDSNSALIRKQNLVSVSNITAHLIFETEDAVDEAIEVMVDGTVHKLEFDTPIELIPVTSFQSREVEISIKSSQPVSLTVLCAHLDQDLSIDTAYFQEQKTLWGQDTISILPGVEKILTFLHFQASGDLDGTMTVKGDFKEKQYRIRSCPDAVRSIMIQTNYQDDIIEIMLPAGLKIAELENSLLIRKMEMVVSTNDGTLIIDSPDATDVKLLKSTQVEEESFSVWIMAPNTNLETVASRQQLAFQNLDIRASLFQMESKMIQIDISFENIKTSYEMINGDAVTIQRRTLTLESQSNAPSTVMVDLSTMGTVEDTVQVTFPSVDPVQIPISLDLESQQSIVITSMNQQQDSVELVARIGGIECGGLLTFNQVSDSSTLHLIRFGIWNATQESWNEWTQGSLTKILESESGDHLIVPSNENLYSVDAGQAGELGLRFGPEEVLVDCEIRFTIYRLSVICSEPVMLASNTITFLGSNPRKVTVNRSGDLFIILNRTEVQTSHNLYVVSSSDQQVTIKLATDIELTCQAKVAKVVPFISFPYQLEKRDQELDAKMIVWENDVSWGDQVRNGLWYRAGQGVVNRTKAGEQVTSTKTTPCYLGQEETLRYGAWFISVEREGEQDITTTPYQDVLVPWSPERVLLPLGQGWTSQSVHVRMFKFRSLETSIARWILSLDQDQPIWESLSTSEQTKVNRFLKTISWHDDAVQKELELVSQTWDKDRIEEIVKSIDVNPMTLMPLRDMISFDQLGGAVLLPSCLDHHGTMVQSPDTLDITFNRTILSLTSSNDAVKAINHNNNTAVRIEQAGEIHVMIFDTMKESGDLYLSLDSEQDDQLVLATQTLEERQPNTIMISGYMEAIVARISIEMRYLDLVNLKLVNTDQSIALPIDTVEYNLGSFTSHQLPIMTTSDQLRLKLSTQDQSLILTTSQAGILIQGTEELRILQLNLAGLESDQATFASPSVDLWDSVWEIDTGFIACNKTAPEQSIRARYRDANTIELSPASTDLNVITIPGSTDEIDMKIYRIEVTIAGTDQISEPVIIRTSSGIVISSHARLTGTFEETVQLTVDETFTLTSIFGAIDASKTIEIAIPGIDPFLVTSSVLTLSIGHTMTIDCTEGVVTFR